MRARAGTPLREDRGSLTVYFVSAVIAAVPLIGLVVDGAAQIRAQQQLDLVATESARTAGQQLEKGQAILGRDVVVDPGDARAAAEEYAAAQGDAGQYRVTSVTVSSDRQSVTVVAESDYQPLVLDAVGIGPGTLDGEGSAYMHRTDANGDEYDYEDR